VVVLAENLVGRLQGRGWLPGRGAKA